MFRQLFSSTVHRVPVKSLGSAIWSVVAVQFVEKFENQQRGSLNKIGHCLLAFRDVRRVAKVEC